MSKISYILYVNAIFLLFFYNKDRYAIKYNSFCVVVFRMLVHLSILLKSCNYIMYCKDTVQSGNLDIIFVKFSKNDETYSILYPTL